MFAHGTTVYTIGKIAFKPNESPSFIIGILPGQQVDAMLTMILSRMNKMEKGVFVSDKKTVKWVDDSDLLAAVIEYITVNEMGGCIRYFSNPVK